MAKVDLIMPKMGESIIEATILKWVKNVGDAIEEDETILEIATDKVDSEIPSPVSGVISKILFQENDVVEVGKVIAIISTEGEGPSQESRSNGQAEVEEAEVIQEIVEPVKEVVQEEIPKPKPQAQPQAKADRSQTIPSSSSPKFYSPLVRNIAAKENISVAELDGIAGSGLNGRVTKKDIMNYLNQGRSVVKEVVQKTSTQPEKPVSKPAVKEVTQSPTSKAVSPATSVSGQDEVIQMDRMRKLIAKHMVMSKQTSPHVTSFVEVDVTNLVNWRNRIKKDFQNKHGEKITYTPLFIQAVAKALADFPMVNVSVDGDQIIVKKDLNIGMAAALPSGNLIVPVIRNADHLNLLGLTKKVNDLAGRARSNKLKPEEIQGGTFTVTNVGTFGNSMGTPIINQPQVAILATGSIKKKPAVLETDEGDVIAIRQMMFLSLSYDHRVVDGFLGGSFLRRVGDYLEQFDATQDV